MRPTDASVGRPDTVGHHEYNWARTGSNTHTLLTEGQHTGLATQVASGQVDFVVLAIGGNGDCSTLAIGSVGDVPFGLVDAYTPVYNQQFPFIGSDGRSYDTVEDYTASIIDRLLIALDTVDDAGAHVILGTAAEHGNVGATLAYFPDSSRRQHVTDAVAAVNGEIKAIAIQRGIPIIDFDGLMGLYLSPDPLIVGGVEITKAWPSSPNPFYFCQPDGIHPGTVVEGLFANAFIEAVNHSYDTNFTPLSDQEILAYAGIPNPNPGGGATYF